MSDKRRADKHKAYQLLKRNGVDLQQHNQIRFNSGSETWRHVICKAAVAYIGQANGYWVSSEVDAKWGEIDVLLWGHPDRMTIAVEVETSPTEAVKEDKIQRYVRKQPGIDEMYLVNVSEMPVDMMHALDYVSDSLGLEP